MLILAMSPRDHAAGGVLRMLWTELSYQSAGNHEPMLRAHELNGLQCLWTHGLDGLQQIRHESEYKR